MKTALPMKLAFLGAKWSPELLSGGAVHIRQFIETAAASDHEIWGFGNLNHPAVQHFSPNPLKRANEFSRIEAVYQRFEDRVLALPPLLNIRRRIRKSPCPEVWELNTVPEFIATARQQSQHDVDALVKEMRTAAPRCDLAVCVTELIAEYATERLGIARTIVVPNGSDPGMFSPDVVPVKRLQPLKEKLNVCWMGSAGLDWNDFELIARLGERLLETSRADIAIHILGRGLRRIELLPPNIHYHGHVTYPRLPAWLAGMDVGLITYKPGPAMYGSPLKLFDYMAAGLAIVSTEQPQVASILREFDAESYVVPYGDGDGLYERLTRLADDRALTQELGARARGRLCEKYRWQDNVDAILGAIHNLRT